VVHVRPQGAGSGVVAQQPDEIVSGGEIRHHVKGARDSRNEGDALVPGGDAVIQVTGSMKVDDILTHEKLDYKNKVTKLFKANLAKMDCGIEIISLDLNNVSPPLKTKAAFTAVTNAGSAAAALIDKAKEYKVREENNVRTQVAQIKADATIYKTEVVSQARADSVYFDSIYKEYKQIIR